MLDEIRQAAGLKNKKGVKDLTPLLEQIATAAGAQNMAAATPQQKQQQQQQADPIKKEKMESEEDQFISKYQNSIPKLKNNRSLARTILNGMKQDKFNDPTEWLVSKIEKQ